MPDASEPDLSDLLKNAVGAVPEFDPVSLAARRRRQRRSQLVGAVSAVVAIVAIVALLTNAGGNGIFVSTRKPASSSTSPSTEVASTTSIGSTTTSVPPVVTTGEGTTTIPAPRAPEPGDFTGTLTVSSTTVRVGEGVDTELRIHNAAGVAIDTSERSSPTTLALYCDRLNPAAPGNNGVFGYYDAWYLTSPTMQPGADAVLTARFAPSADLVGDASCQAVIVGPPIPRFFSPWVVVTAIPAVRVTVLPADTGTTTTTTPTTTAVPTTTVPTT
jgi:hypothetical protein